MATEAIAQAYSTPGALNSNDENTAQQWFKAISFAALIVLTWFAVAQSFAGGTDEFTEGATQGENWVRGNLGKIACLLALVVGMFYCSMRKDWSWMVNAVFIALAVGIVVGIINGAFSAVI